MRQKITTKPTSTTRRTRPGRPDSDVVIESWRARSEDVASRLTELQARYVPEATVGKAWRAVVRQVAAHTADWPSRLATHAAPGTTPEIRRLLAFACHPTYPNTTPYPGILHELFTALADHFEPGALAPLAAPARVRVPRLSPVTSAAARAQWLALRARYVREKLAVRTGHRRREDVCQRIPEALLRFRVRWFQRWPQYLATAPSVRDAEAVAAALRDETLRTLAATFQEAHTDDPA